MYSHFTNWLIIFILPAGSPFHTKNNMARLTWRWILAASSSSSSFFFSASLLKIHGAHNTLLSLTLLCATACKKRTLGAMTDTNGSIRQPLLLLLCPPPPPPLSPLVSTPSSPRRREGGLDPCSTVLLFFSFFSRELRFMTTLRFVDSSTGC